MYILGIDTTGDTLSVALGNESSILGSVYMNTGKKHSKTLMPAIDYLLKLCSIDVADVDVFACAAGPGSYTGIRIGVATASALAFGTGKKTASVNILDAMIKDVNDEATVCALINARNQDVYAKAVKNGEVILDTCVMQIKDVVAHCKEKTIFIGDGAYAYKNIIENQSNKGVVYNSAIVNAVNIVKIAQVTKNNYLEFDEIKPLYLRETQAERMRGTNL